MWNAKKQKHDKPPRSGTTGRMEKGTLNAPGFLVTFDVALTTMRRCQLDGIGISLEHAGLTGADLDGCISDSGLLSPLAAEVVGYGETYAEFSPSGTGIHFLAEGAGAELIKRDDLGVELYSTGRYFTVTCNRLDESPEQVRAAPTLIERLARLDAETPKPGRPARAKANGHAKPEGGDFWSRVNSAALDNRDKWVPILHPTARKEPGTGAWRVTSLDLGRDREEDISYHADGIQDFGDEHGMTAIDAVQRFGGASDASEAALWLCRQLGVEPASLGWSGRRTKGASQKAEQARASAHVSEEPQSSPLPAEPPLIRIVAGRLSEVANRGEGALLSAGVPFYQRSGALVRPVTDTVSASGGRKTKTASLQSVSVTYPRDQLCRVAGWERHVRREDKWIPADPPKDVAETILARAGEWKFPNINGMLTTPTLRPDGSLLSAHGYDEATGLLLFEPPKLSGMPAEPTKADATKAVELLDSLLAEFPFVDNASRSVALSALMTPVVRGAFPVPPGHVGRAPTPGTGKSYLFDVASAIAVGQPCQVIAAGRTEEETEKRLSACLRAGYPIVNVDNVNDELGGDFLCQLTERPLVSPRVLGKSDTPQIPNRMTVFATGNNIRLKGDMVRRALICRLDARLERPEARTFRTSRLLK